MTGASAGGNWLLESVTTYAGGTPETSTFDSSNGKIYYVNNGTLTIINLASRSVSCPGGQPLLIQSSSSATTGTIWVAQETADCLASTYLVQLALGTQLILQQNMSTDYYNVFSFTSISDGYFQSLLQSLGITLP